MKAKILSQNGESKKEIEMPSCFSGKIRKDICQKYFEAVKAIQPYGSFPEAGKHHSASGLIRKSRRLWKNSYGHGMSRVPRKILWRRGKQFYWVGAETSGTRGGRQSHPPRAIQFQKEVKLNKKEKRIAIVSALTATMLSEMIKKRYSSIKTEKINAPFVFEDSVLKLKSKDFFKLLEKIFGDLYGLALQQKKQRAGKGKARGRRYKKNAGLLFVIGNKETFGMKGIEVKKVSELGINDIYPLGRLTVYSEEAIKEIGAKWK